MKCKLSYSIILASLILIPLSSILLTGCISDPSCYEHQKIHAGLSLDSMVIWSPDHTVLVVTDQWDTISVTGIPNDSVLYNQSRGLNRLQLPLRPDTNVTTFRLDWHQMSDTIFIRHLNDYKYISFACGCYVYYVIDSVWSSHHFIDAFYITDSDVQDQDTENIRLSVQQ